MSESWVKSNCPNKEVEISFSHIDLDFLKVYEKWLKQKDYNLIKEYRLNDKSFNSIAVDVLSDVAKYYRRFL